LQLFFVFNKIIYNSTLEFKLSKHNQSFICSETHTYRIQAHGWAGQHGSKLYSQLFTVKIIKLWHNKAIIHVSGVRNTNKKLEQKVYH